MVAQVVPEFVLGMLICINALSDFGDLIFNGQLGKCSLREKLVKIGAKVVRHGRYIIFQMAEVAVPRELFKEILRLIAELRPPPAATPA
jgi:hypothetical protein